MTKRKRFEEGRGGATPEMVGDTAVGSPDRDRVAMRAYELYLARGGGEGQAMDDWLSAERELTSGGPSRREP